MHNIQQQRSGVSIETANALNTEPDRHKYNYTHVYLLLGRVSQLILAAPVVALLDAFIGPQRLDRLDILRVERRHCLVVDLAYQLTKVLHHRSLKSRTHTCIMQAGMHGIWVPAG